MKYLFDIGENAMKKDSLGNTPIHHAAIAGYLEIFLFLISK
jgi:ankyrin repeat protein